ncbi:MAG TPA: hypothetical protein VNO30_00725 [Kofleriaceae bacterium]|nr:hypothetical protein [Kofleriaceae bacterium]
MRLIVLGVVVVCAACRSPRVALEPRHAPDEIKVWQVRTPGIKPEHVATVDSFDKKVVFALSRDPRVTIEAMPDRMIGRDVCAEASAARVDYLATTSIKVETNSRSECKHYNFSLSGKSEEECGRWEVYEPTTTATLTLTFYDPEPCTQLRLGREWRKVYSGSDEWQPAVFEVVGEASAWVEKYLNAQ